MRHGPAVGQGPSPPRRSEGRLGSRHWIRATGRQGERPGPLGQTPEAPGSREIGPGLLQREPFVVLCPVLLFEKEGLA